ncbi:MAG TPA: glycosyltransferase family 2 protein [Gemmatimonadaceae bacterium]
MIAPLACVIPALNASRSLAAVIRGLRTAVPHATLIVVDDGSSDDTYAAALACADAVIRFRANRGKGAALRAGIADALSRDVSAVLTIDADGQHEAAAAPALLAALRDADVVIGARRRDRGLMPIGRRVTNALASAAVGAIVGRPVPDPQSGFRAVRRAVLDHVHATGDRYEFETDFLIRAAQAGFRIIAVPVPTVYGAPSHFRGVRDSVRVARTIWRYRAGARR